MDREKVVNALECCIDGTLCAECDYEGINRCFDKVLPADVLAMLKEQETANLYKCPNCGTWVSAENVVLCKDCKHFQMHEWGDFHKRIWPEDGDRWYECLHPDDDGEHGTRTRGPEWFCADGERRTPDE